MHRPGIADEMIFAVPRLMFWLVLLGWVKETPPAIRLILVAAWLLAFCWRYMFRTASDPLEDEKLRERRALIGLTMSTDLIPFVVLLCLLTAIVIPWWWAALTGACSSVAWFEQVWPHRPTLIPPGLPLASGALLLVLQTATYPLAEEFAMRGWLLVPLRRRFGTHRAVVFVALLFALLHLVPSPIQLLILFLFGIMLGYAVVATGSLWTAVTMHFTWNFTLTLLSAPPLKAYLGEAFRTTMFRCAASGLMLALTLVAYGTIFAVARRRFRVPNRQANK
jgi:membrane protease YdiL (CAAX protease family)